ncbi:MAG: zf-HC2 domain-containing protein, partial [Candidatus Aminicenantes bacterium]|nr:zf-HC2 domain-containing protein [Candidatus Aminicenantes bacterium]
MSKCLHTGLIDDYLFNRLDEREKEKFEEHYFNCPACFEELKHRSEILAVIKEQGPTLFQNLKEPVSARRPSFFP